MKAALMRKLIVFLGIIISSGMILAMDLNEEQQEISLQDQFKKLTFKNRIVLHAALLLSEKKECLGSDSCLRKKIFKVCELSTQAGHPLSSLICEASKYVGDNFEYGPYNNLLPSTAEESRKLKTLTTKIMQTNFKIDRISMSLFSLCINLI